MLDSWWPRPNLATKQTVRYQGQSQLSAEVSTLAAEVPGSQTWDDLGMSPLDSQLAEAPEVPGSLTVDSVSSQGSPEAPLDSQLPEEEPLWLQVGYATPPRRFADQLEDPGACR